eukprot:TRINITY_DN8385_c0_g1_i1.p1 TRINITY_DN8385_c0_g1~~TRINITY_DN8385_c0_g1_i1.p1  ORF type:complete len:367 (+),score=25.74 TRINITY_DN8385_c0_g1_i1:185-1285(+)
MQHLFTPYRKQLQGPKFKPLPFNELKKMDARYPVLLDETVEASVWKYTEHQLYYGGHPRGRKLRLAKPDYWEPITFISILSNSNMLSFNLLKSPVFNDHSYGEIFCHSIEQPTPNWGSKIGNHCKEFSPYSSCYVTEKLAMKKKSSRYNSATPCLEHEWLIFDNREKSAKVTHILEEARQMAKNDLLVFVSEDMYLPPGWEQLFFSRLHSLDTSDPNWALMGVQGKQNKSKTPMDINNFCMEGIRFCFHSPGASPEVIHTTSESLIIMRKKRGLTFEQSIPFNFFWANDLVFSASLRNMSSYLLNVITFHKFRQEDGSLGTEESYHRHAKLVNGSEIHYSAVAFTEKWKKHLQKLPITKDVFGFLI